MFRRENFQTFAVGKDKGFKFYRKIFELGRYFNSMKLRDVSRRATSKTSTSVLR